VQVSYPCDENAVEATQQLIGNLFSALLVPICQTASNFDLQLARSSVDIRGDTLILIGIMATTVAAFSTFDTPLSRSLLDAQGEPEGAEVEPANTVA
jgi:FLVCR family feline leukemia virus subgroup C receptor-related protein